MTTTDPEAHFGLTGTSGPRRSNVNKAWGALLLCGLPLAWASGMAACTAWAYRWHVLSVWVVAELLFYLLYFQRRYRELNAQPEVHAPSQLEALRLFRRFLDLRADLPEQVEVRAYMSTWFRGADFNTIRRGNVEELMAYGFWYKTLDQMRQAGRGHIPSDMVDQVEAVFQVKFPPGYNPSLSFMGHLWEPLRASYRPAVFYAATEALALAGRLALRVLGFQHWVQQDGGMSYYTYDLPAPQELPPLAAAHKGGGLPPSTAATTNTSSNTTAAAAPGNTAPASDGLALPTAAGATPMYSMPGQLAGLAGGSPNGVHIAADGRRAAPGATAASTAPGEVPVLFLHGVGGLALYVQMIRYVAQLGHPVLMVDMKHVSLRLSKHIPDVDEVCARILQVLESHHLQQVAVIAHSYGTFVASRMVQRHPDRLASLCLIDPVCFGMFIPHLLHNFIYRRPQLGLSRPSEALRQLVLFLASRDLHLAAAFARRFYWSDVNLWPDDLPPGSVVLLSGQDDLVAVQDVRAMLERHPNIKVLYTAHAFHGSFLLDGPLRASLLQEVAGLLSQAGRSLAAAAAPLLQPTLRRLTSYMEGRPWASTPHRVVRSLTDGLSALSAQERHQLQLGLSSRSLPKLQRPSEVLLQDVDTHATGSVMHDNIHAAHQPASNRHGSQQQWTQVGDLRLTKSMDPPRATDTTQQRDRSADATRLARWLNGAAVATGGAPMQHTPPQQADAGGTPGFVTVGDSAVGVEAARSMRRADKPPGAPAGLRLRKGCGGNGSSSSTTTGAATQQMLDGTEAPASSTPKAAGYDTPTAVELHGSRPGSCSVLARTAWLASDIQVGLQALQLADAEQADPVVAGSPWQMACWQQQVQQPLATCQEAMRQATGDVSAVEPASSSSTSWAIGPDSSGDSTSGGSTASFSAPAGAGGAAGVLPTGGPAGVSTVLHSAAPVPTPTEVDLAAIAAELKKQLQKAGAR